MSDVDERDLKDGEVEALAQHVIRPDDLKLGYAAQHAAEQAVEYKLARLLTMSLAEPVEIELEWVCRGRAIGVKGSLNPRRAITTEVKVLPPSPPSCRVCGMTATTTKKVPYDDDAVLEREEPRCRVHA